MIPPRHQTKTLLSGFGGQRGRSARETNPPNAIMKIMQKLHLLILAGCLAAGSQGCNQNGSETATGPAQKKLHLAFVANSPGEYWALVNLGCDIAAQQLGDVDLDFRFPAEATAEAQQAILTKLVAAGVDGIAISPIDADKQTDFLNNIAAKTLLVCADSDAEKSQRVTYIGTDNVMAGTQAADLIKAALPQGGHIALFVGYPTAQNTKDRLQGIQAGLAGSNIRIVATLEDGQKSTIAEKNVGEALAKHPDLAGVVGISGYHGPALLAALHDAGQTGKVKIVCFDDNSDTLAGIVAGDIYGTIAQKPFQIGKQAIVHMDKYLRGDKTQLTDAKIFTPSRALTKENAGDFIAERKGISLYLKDVKDERP